MSEVSADAAEPEMVPENCDEERSKRFRFKSQMKDDQTESDAELRGHKRRREHRSSHRHSKRHRSSKHDEDSRRRQDHASYTLPPEQAFRESLFDALGDDEGASFWERVYGQPIHTYPNTYQDEETGELEQMTDEEYAMFVRRKMWEKSWEGIEAAREEKRREREKQRQRMREAEDKKSSEKQARHEDYLFDVQIEKSLRRGERRKDRKRWQAQWEEYLRRWEDLRSLSQAQQTAREDAEHVFLRNKIAWPVESGKRKDLVREEIERFVKNGTAHYDSEGHTPSSPSFANAIKAERVRWHPDKIQQRYGFMEIDENTLKGVTAVFQVFDAIWTELRDEAA